MIENRIIAFIKQNSNSSSKEIFEGIERKKSLATVKRILSKLIQNKLLITTGKGKSTRYNLSPFYKLFEQIDIEKYYENEIDERQISKNFNFAIVTDILSQTNIFTEQEIEYLNLLQETYKKISHT